MAFIVALIFPSVHSSVYFHPKSPILTTTHNNYKTIDDKSHKVILLHKFIKINLLFLRSTYAILRSLEVIVVSNVLRVLQKVS